MSHMSHKWPINWTSLFNKVAYLKCPKYVSFFPSKNVVATTLFTQACKNTFFYKVVKVTRRCLANATCDLLVFRIGNSSSPFDMGHRFQLPLVQVITS